MNDLPTLTVIVPAHNEEAIIAEKLESILSQEYPEGKLEVIVASDVSTDRTEEIVRSFEPRGITLVAFKERHGKLGALDELIPQARGEVIVVTDANVILAPNALKHLAASYCDPHVGAASGYQTVEHPGRETTLREEVWYRTFEANLKKNLSRVGFLVGAFGGFYSLRRTCFRPIGPKPMEDDIVFPLEAISQGYKSVFVENALGYEEIGETMNEEYRRRIRMTAYNLNALGRAVRLGAKRGLLPLYIVFSYKVLRWIAPFLWTFLFISALFLAGHGTIYTATAVVMALGVISAIAGLVGSLAGRRWGLLSNAFYFAVMNFASFPGVVLWMRGVNRFWAPRAG